MYLTRSTEKQTTETLITGGFDNDTIEKAKKYLDKEILRLRNPKLTYSQDEDEAGYANGYGYLEKKDFYDLLMLIQLKTKLKLQRDTHRKQRERTRLLERAVNYKGSSNQNEVRNQFELYVKKTMELMQ